tara:strand:- start:503 stop:712 length:210 start_codon:yes stop_codon:yes gene_type:complete
MGGGVWRFGVEIFFEISVFEIENNLFYNLTIGVGTCVQCGKGEFSIFSPLEKSRYIDEVDGRYALNVLA